MLANRILGISPHNRNCMDGGYTADTQPYEKEHNLTDLYRWGGYHIKNAWVSAFWCKGIVFFREETRRNTKIV